MAPEVAIGENMTRISRMSSAGHCIKRLYCEALHIPSEPVPPWLADSADEGKEQEQSIKRRLRSEGYVVEDCPSCPTCKALGLEREGIHVETEIEGTLFVGHLDGKVTPPVTSLNTPDLLECKSMSWFQFRRWGQGGFEEFPDYRAQLALYFHATGLPRALFCVKDRNNGKFEKNPVFASEFGNLVHDIAIKHKLLHECIENEVMPTGFYDASSYECKWCLWRKLCKPEPVKLDGDVEDKLMQASDIYRNGVRMVKQGYKMQDDAKALFLAQSKATNKRRWIFNNLGVSWVSVKESVQYPKKKLLEVFTPEQLEPAAEKKDPYEFIKLQEIER